MSFETVVIDDVEMPINTDAERDAAVKALRDAGEESTGVYYGTGEGAYISGRELRASDGSIVFIKPRR